MSLVRPTSHGTATRRSAPPCTRPWRPVSLEHPQAVSATAYRGITRLSTVFYGPVLSLEHSERARRSHEVSHTSDRAKTALGRMAHPLDAFYGPAAALGIEPGTTRTFAWKHVASDVQARSTGVQKSAA